MADLASASSSRVNRVDIPIPLTLRENGKILRIFVHPDVPMRNHFISKLDSQCIAKLPLGATHILLDLLPPHGKSSMVPTIEQRGFIEHRGDRRVLCGYWAQECLRIEGVAESDFWDLSGWDSNPGILGGREKEVIMVEDDDEIQAIDEQDSDHTPVPASASSGSRGTAGKGVKRVRRGNEAGSRASTSGPSEERLVTPHSTQVSSQYSRSKYLNKVKGKARSEEVSPAKKRSRKSNYKSQAYIEDPSTDEEPPPQSPSEASAESSEGTENEYRRSPQPSHRRPSARAPRKKRPKMGDMSAEEIQEQYDYFLTFTHSALRRPIPDGAHTMGTGKLVKQWMLKDVHGMWCEARTKYCRRDLDTMSIMLSTWKVAREHKLSAEALRRYYTDFKGRIRHAQGDYVPVDQRPPNWPFHRRPPENAEAGVKWIFDWGTPGAISFLKQDRGGGQGVANGEAEEMGEVGPQEQASGEVKDEFDSEDDVLVVDEGFLDAEEGSTEGMNG